MEVGNVVILANLGEMKVYDAMPRDLEAEAGVKPKNVKLDLVDNRDYVLTHWKLHEIVTDQAGRFKGGSQGRGTFSRGSIGERHSLEQEIEEKVVQEVAKDISQIVMDKKASWYLAMPETIYKRVMDIISPAAKEKLVKALDKDMMKCDKTELIEIFR
ncbi:MAG: host attachment protein [Campylobacterota bacterium]|nr:host attachment protein [Campylobacterota bacterium]